MFVFFVSISANARGKSFIMLSFSLTSVAEERERKGVSFSSSFKACKQNQDLGIAELLQPSAAIALLLTTAASSSLAASKVEKASLFSCMHANLASHNQGACKRGGATPFAFS